MEITRLNDESFLETHVENVTQPSLRVALRILTLEDPRIVDKMTKVAHYMTEQSKMLIPYFYELRNELPRGRVQQMMANRAKTLHEERDAVMKATYAEIVSADEFDFSAHIPLQSITVRGNIVHVQFACQHDQEFIYFERKMEIPFTNPRLWAEVEAFEKMRLAEIALAAEKAMRAGMGQVDDQDLDDAASIDDDLESDEDRYSMAS